MLFVCKKTSFLILLCLTISLYSERLAISDFRLPCSKVYGIKLSAEGYHYYGNSFTFDILPFYRYLSDTREFYSTLYSSAGYNYGRVDISISPSLGTRQYIFSTPLFLYGALDYGYDLERRPVDNKYDWVDYARGDIEIGSGFGHLREGQYVAIALQINELLREAGIISNDLRRKTILEIAGIISQKHFFSYSHDRYQKYLFQEIEKILLTDPACSNNIPIYTWFKIIEIADSYIYYWYPDVTYWQRKFGTRFSVDFLASDIYKHRADYPRKSFPLNRSYGYTPSLRFKFEYENPLDLRKQIAFTTYYAVEWNDNTTDHSISTEFRYGYGIINRFLIENKLPVAYTYTISENTNAHGFFTVSPQIQFNYYVEDLIALRFEYGYDFRVAPSDPLDNDYDFTTDLFFSFGIDWRIF